MSASLSSARACSSKTRMNSRPMILRLVSGIGDAGQVAEELVLRVGDDELRAGRRDEVALDRLGLALAQQAVVDEDAGELVADGALHDRGGDGGVDTAGQPAQHPLVADLLAYAGDGLLGDRGRLPGRADSGDLVEERRQHPLAVLGVQHLRVPLHAGELAPGVLERRHRSALGRGERGESGGSGMYGVAVAHPRVEAGGDIGEEPSGLVHGDDRTAELGQAGLRDVAAERAGHRLEAVADAEDRDARVEQGGIDLRGAVRVHRLRPSGQHDRGRLAGDDVGDRRGVRDDLGVDVRLTDATRDQLRVLRAEVDDEHGVPLRGPPRQRTTAPGPGGRPGRSGARNLRGSRGETTTGRAGGGGPPRGRPGPPPGGGAAAKEGAPAPRAAVVGGGGWTRRPWGGAGGVGHAPARGSTGRVLVRRASQIMGPARPGGAGAGAAGPTACQRPESDAAASRRAGRADAARGHRRHGPGADHRCRPGPERGHSEIRTTSRSPSSGRRSDRTPPRRSRP